MFMKNITKKFPKFKIMRKKITSNSSNLALISIYPLCCRPSAWFSRLVPVNSSPIKKEPQTSHTESNLSRDSASIRKVVSSDSRFRFSSFSSSISLTNNLDSSTLPESASSSTFLSSSSMVIVIIWSFLSRSFESETTVLSPLPKRHRFLDSAILFVLNDIWVHKFYFYGWWFTLSLILWTYYGLRY